MKERPIIFSGPEVLAILAGRKTQTRRIVKLNPADVKRWKDEPNPAWEKECPFHPLTRLWVREAWLEYPWVGPDNKEWMEVAYRADGEDSYPRRDGDRWRSPLHMPRRLSRITLKVTDVRVQRLSEIDSADVIAEGFDCFRDFADTWDTLLRASGGCAANPWVWRIVFSRLNETKNIPRVRAAEAEGS